MSATAREPGDSTPAPDNRPESRRSGVRVTSPTERMNPQTTDLDLQSTERALLLMNDEDLLVAPAVRAVIPALAGVVDEATARVQAGGRVHYFGAGTSGRLAVLDAAELMPTFGLGDRVIAHHAGGTAALVEAVEDAEDSAEDGAAAAAVVTVGDLVIGLTASGRTPYVGGALGVARSVGAFTVLMTANPQADLGRQVDVLLAADTGPEALTGSTRLKAGTAEKLMLNAFSTVLMMRLGRVYSNLMIDMRATNAKLRGRSVQMLEQASGAPADACAAALTACGDIKTALVLLLWGGDSPGVVREADVDRCRQALKESGGLLRQALRVLPDG